MAESDDAQAQLLRQFQAAIAGLDGRELQDLGRRLLDTPPRSARPELRRAPLPQPATLRIRVDLDGAQPPIWRRLDLHGELTLDVVHQALQAAFDWTDSHLHRFSLGNHPFHPAAALFLCPFDVQEGEDDGVPAADVRLDETLQEPGDRLHYLYDYGDSWELTLELEEVRPRSDTPARAVGGARSAPPEDSGGSTDPATLSLLVPDPAAFDLAAVDHQLQTMAALAGAHPRAAELCTRLAHLPIGAALARALGSPVSTPSDAQISTVTAAHRWFLDRAADGGIPLTSAGYLRPDDVLVASAVVPGAAGWIGARNREIQTFPVLAFRESLQHLGLLRKHKGTLRLTRQGTAARHGPAELWATLAASLVPAKIGFAQDATLLMLTRTADPAPSPVRPDDVVIALDDLGYRHPDGTPVELRDLLDLPAVISLENVDEHIRRPSWTTHPLATALARAALQR